MPGSILSHVIPECAENIQENKRQKPVIFSLPGYILIVRQVHQHPPPEPDQWNPEDCWNQLDHDLLSFDPLLFTAYFIHFRIHFPSRNILSWTSNPFANGLKKPAISPHACCHFPDFTWIPLLGGGR
jgi:hypothetical protein